MQPPQSPKILSRQLVESDELVIESVNELRRLFPRDDEVVRCDSTSK